MLKTINSITNQFVRLKIIGENPLSEQEIPLEY